MSASHARNPQLEAAILAAPDDPAAYLVYADWLHERGNDLGTVISLAHAALQDPGQRPAAERAIRDYEARHHLNQGVRLTWRMGVVDTAVVTELGQDDIVELLAHPTLAFMRELTVGQRENDFGDGDDFMVRTFGRTPTQLLSLAPIATAKNLRALQVADQCVHDLRPLRELTRLQCLGLAETSVTDIEPLAHLPHLSILSLRASSVSDIAPLRSLSGLTALNLAATGVDNMAVLADLNQLVHLDVGGQPLGDDDLDWLTGLPHLKTLTVAATELTRLTGFDQLESLEELCLNSLSIADLTPLAALPRLRYLEVFSLPADAIRGFLAARAQQPHARRRLIIVGADDVSDDLDEGFAEWIGRRPRDDRERLWWLVR